MYKLRLDLYNFTLMNDAIYFMIPDQKRQLRRVMSQKRRVLHQTFTANMPCHHANIIKFLQNIEQHYGAHFFSNKVMATYLAIGSELDPAFIRTWGATINAISVLPVVVADNAPLIFREYHDGDILVDEKFGTKAPSNTALMRDPDIIITPLLSYDVDKFRLGYGGGFYDRTLAAYHAKNHPVITIGLCYDGQYTDKVPIETTDKRLDYIITEQRLI